MIVFNRSMKYKNVTIEGNITFLMDIGDNVMFDPEFDWKLKGRIGIITDVKTGLSGTGILVKVDIYDAYVDSNWLTYLP